MPMSWRARIGIGFPRLAATRLATSCLAVASSSCGPSRPTADRTSPSATPRWRSSAASALRARPRPWCRLSTQARAKAASSIRPTSANRPRTESATSSGTRRLRSAVASCARVRGPLVSSRRQISRAASSPPGSGPPGSTLLDAAPAVPRPPGLPPQRLPSWELPPSGSSPPEIPLPRPSPESSTMVSRPAPRFLADAPPLAVPLLAFRRSGVGRSLSRTTGALAEPGHGLAASRVRCARGIVRDGAQATGACRWLLVRRFRVQARANAELLLEPLLDLVGKVGVVAQEVPRVLLTLPELVALVGVPGTGLAHDGLLHSEVNETALPADPDTEQNVELRGTERRSAVVHDHVLGNQVVEALHFHIEGAAKPWRQDARHPGEPELLRRDVTQEEVVKCLSQPLQPVTAQPGYSENGLHPSLGVACPFTDQLGGYCRTDAPLLQVAEYGPGGLIREIDPLRSPVTAVELRQLFGQHPPARAPGGYDRGELRDIVNTAHSDFPRCVLAVDPAALDQPASLGSGV